MPRRAHTASSGLVFHVLNRSVRRTRIFESTPDYENFRAVLEQALGRVPTRLLAYCIMPNHWHLVLWPFGGEMSRFMHWLTLTHAKRVHYKAGSNGSGPIYQNRFKAIAIQNDAHLLTVVRYVERNPLRAGLTERAERWPWSSLWQRSNAMHPVPLSEWPVPRPQDWIGRVNEPQTQAELARVRDAIRRSRPLGDEEWTASTMSQLGIFDPPRGRPRNRNRV